jgi:hypothetical protein
MMQRVVLAFVASAAAAILAVSWSGSAAAQWTFALLGVAFPPALVWIAVARRRPSLRLSLSVAVLFGLLEASTVAVLALRNPGGWDRWLLGLPPAGLVFLLGLWLLPFVLTTWAHATTFDSAGLGPDDLDALRRRHPAPPD